MSQGVAGVRQGPALAAREDPSLPAPDPSLSSSDPSLSYQEHRASGWGAVSRVESLPVSTVGYADT